ncbi:MAG: MFS transporter [Candidatus Azobacteroides sp.]|nr:MFS transporter [Candidatus Azobacteroides sp.]
MYNKISVYISACLGMTFFGIAFIVMGSVLPSVTAKYSLDPVGASSLVTFLPIGVLSGSLVFGPIVDRFGYKNLLIISTFISALGLIGLSYFDRLNLLRFCIFLIGFGGGILNGETNALVADICDGNERNAKLSFLGVFYGVGALGIPLLLGTLSKIYSYEIILSRTGFFMLLCIICFAVVRFPKPKHAQGFPIKKALSLIKEPILLLLSLVLFFQCCLEGLLNNWTTSYLTASTPIPDEKIIFSLTFLILGITLSRIALAFLLQSAKPYSVLTIGMIITWIGSILLYYFTHFTPVAIGLFLVGSGMAGVFPIVMGFIGNHYKETTGTAIGIVLFIGLCGNSLINYLMGYVSEVFGIKTFPVLILLILGLQAIALFCEKRKAKG